MMADHPCVSTPAAVPKYSMGQLLVQSCQSFKGRMGEFSHPLSFVMDSGHKQTPPRSLNEKSLNVAVKP